MDQHAQSTDDTLGETLGETLGHEIESEAAERKALAPSPEASQEASAEPHTAPSDEPPADSAENGPEEAVDASIEIDLSADTDASAEVGTEDSEDSEDAETPSADPEDAADAEDAAAAYARASVRDFETEPEARADDGDSPLVAHRGEKPRQLVVVNDVPGEETRIAILEQGRLAQFFSERAATSTNVGSIYKARVVNVEPAIQAAFVDFGEGANGFLHISDLHPKYFPKKKGSKESDESEDDGKVRTEKVGRKVPRRARPMMQDALKRGQEIIVQVLKEGIGSKGPTVTSYISIPGRLLVMMPDMDNVGVSRKVEDEDGRRKMRKILDSLELPSGFGFILRTAGFSATRTELSRDAQYLTRLWQVMEKRMNAVGAPCQLYAEGDILLRTIRDAIDHTVDGIVVDSEHSFNRAKAFLEVVSPRTATKVHFYDRRTPVFHAFDVERQVDTIHSREVPLPSGGALVIDQAEALVAIDVNSGRSRSARDSETNAYQTNQEAVDEIARQLRLRDLGGVVICDLIDMRTAKHRRDIEERLKKNLARDRAKTTVGQISEFGIVEMTRQRMRPSIRKTHYTDCPHCAGSGEIRMPDSVAADTMRRIQLVLDTERVARVEVVCSSRVAALLLSRRRRALVELEDLFSKRIDIRISDSIAIDQVDIYAYDERNSDVELERSRKTPIPALASLPTEIPDDDGVVAEGSSGAGGVRKKRRRRRKPAAADATSIILAGGFDDLPEIDEDEPSMSDALDAEAKEKARKEKAQKAAERDADEDGEDDGEKRGKRRRRRRGGRGRGKGEGDGEGEERAAEQVAPAREPSEPIRVYAIAREMEMTSKDVLAKCAELGIEVKGHQSLLAGEQGDELRKAFSKPPFDAPPPPEPAVDGVDDDPDAEATESAEGEGGGRKRRRRRRRRGGRGRSEEAGESEGDEHGEAESSDESSSKDEPSNEPAAEDEGDGDDDGAPRRRRRRRRGGRGRKDRGDAPAEPAGTPEAKRSDSSGSSAGKSESRNADTKKPEAEAAAPKRRSLYGGRTRKLAPGERPKGGGDE